MSKASGHKKQHFIPQCYLKVWCDPDTPENYDPYVWVFTKDGETLKNKAPENIFHENNMYSINRADGKRHLVLEHGLNQLETDFTEIRNRKLELKQSLTDEEHVKLCAFTAALQARTKATREHHKNQWKQPLEMMERLSEWAKIATSEQKKKAFSLVEPPSSEGSSFTYEDVKKIVDTPMQRLLLPLIEAITPNLCVLDLAALTTDDDIGFITSDNPCVWFDPEAYKRPPLYRGPALIYDTIEITAPISPRQCLFFNRRGISGYIDVKLMWVDEINRRTRFLCDEYFIVRKNHKKDMWFNAGLEPEDSWDKKRKKQNDKRKDP